jgi:hypothetical protein
MSKYESEWKELPDFSNDNYGFMDDVTREVWSWEFLRRRQDYRDDCDYYWKVVKKAKKLSGEKWEYSELAMHYMPPKISKNETEHEWLKRMVKSKNPTFARTAIHEYFPKKWGLIHMAPYDKPYGRYVGFLPSLYQYPCLMQDAEKLLLLIEENTPAPESHEASIKAVKNDIALIAFDLTKPLSLVP